MSKFLIAAALGLGLLSAAGAAEAHGPAQAHGYAAGHRPHFAPHVTRQHHAQHQRYLPPPPPRHGWRAPMRPPHRQYGWR